MMPGGRTPGDRRVSVHPRRGIAILRFSLAD